MQRLGFALVLACVFVPLAASAQRATRAEYRGNWVPARAECESSLYLRVDATHVALVNGTDQQEYADIGWPARYWGPDYKGISVAAMPEIGSGDSPFIVVFNADEKPGVTEVVIPQSPEVKGAHASYNENIRRKKELARRFPLNDMPLKKCGGLSDLSVTPAAPTDPAPAR